ncbi:unnamed protein product [Symbiodinium natans]|uniref:Uncharacterized protein n=1 Tax=Symbiodinium natans TaxID=878477 RepID=A0A812GHT6_9DINO|nr:unnamed protein product [Symbiodinium natans]
MISCLPPAFGLGALLLRQGKSATRDWLEFVLDASKQLFGFVLLWALHFSRPSDEALRLSGPVAEATCGVVFQYLLLQSLSRVMELSTGSADFRTGEYRNEEASIVPGRYLRQLLVWLLCVASSEAALWALSVPSLFRGPVALLLEVTSWSSSLEDLTELFAPCLALAVQLWLTDAFIQKGGLPPWQAAALVLWALASAAGSLLGALAATCRGFLRLWPSAGGPLGEPLVSDLEKGPGETVLASGQAKDAAPPVPEVPKARGALLRAAVAEDADFISPPALPSLPTPREKKPWLAPLAPLAPAPVADLGPAKAPFQQFQNLSGMFAERDSELKELHEELDELLGGLGLEHLMQASPMSPPSPSPASRPSQPEPLRTAGSGSVKGVAKSVNGAPGVATPGKGRSHGQSQDHSQEQAAQPAPHLASGCLRAPQNARAAAEAEAEGLLLPMPQGPAAPTPRTVWGSPQSSGTSPHSPHHAAGSVKSAPGAAPCLPKQSVSGPAPAASENAASPQRKSRRYDVLDRKIESLLSALGTSSARPSNGENGFPREEAGQSAPSVDERIQRLQKKMEQLFHERVQGEATGEAAP